LYKIGEEFKIDKTLFNNDAQYRKYSDYTFIFDKDTTYIQGENLYNISDKPVLETTINHLKKENLKKDIKI